MNVNLIGHSWHAKIISDHTKLIYKHGRVKNKDKMLDSWSSKTYLFGNFWLIFWVEDLDWVLVEHFYINWVVNSVVVDSIVTLLDQPYIVKVPQVIRSSEFATEHIGFDQLHFLIWLVKLNWLDLARINKAHSKNENERSNDVLPPVTLPIARKQSSVRTRHQVVNEIGRAANYEETTDPESQRVLRKN